MTASDFGAPDRLRIEASPFRVRVMFAGHVIADSNGALAVRRGDGEPAYFFPPEDVETGYLGKTGETTHDALLGEGSCYTWVMEGEILERAVCAYEDPAAGAEALRGYFTFQDPQFEIYELTEADLQAAPRATHVHRSHA